MLLSLRHVCNAEMSEGRTNKRKSAEKRTAGRNVLSRIRNVEL